MTLVPPRQLQPAHGGIQGGEQQVLGQHLGFGQPVEQGGLAGIGVADQRDHRERHLLARLAAQAAGALDLFQLVLDLARCARRSGGGRFRSGFRRDRPESRSRRAGAPDGSSCAPAASADRSDAPVRPAAALPAWRRARRRFPGSARCGPAPWLSQAFSRLRCCTGDSCALTMMTSGFSARVPGRRSPPPCRCRSGSRASAGPAARCCASTTFEADGGGQPDRFRQARLGIAQRAAPRCAVLGLDMNDKARCAAACSPMSGDSCAASS